ncbi:MAG: hypothetical protein J6L81_01890 [Clostridia bacterium]|nr:hypothetical protein [Clostridia bacterium]
MEENRSGVLRQQLLEEKQKLSMAIDQLTHLDSKIIECDEHLERKKKDIPWKMIVPTAITLLPGLIFLLIGRKFVGIVLLAAGIYFGFRLISEFRFDRKFYQRVDRRKEEYMLQRQKLEKEAAECRGKISEIQSKLGIQ